MRKLWCGFDIRFTMFAGTSKEDISDCLEFLLKSFGASVGYCREYGQIIDSDIRSVGVHNRPNNKFPPWKEE